MSACHPARSGSQLAVPGDSTLKQSLSRAHKNRIMEAARRLKRRTYRPGSGQHGGDLKNSDLDVLWHLLYRGWGRSGCCDPSLLQIAQEKQLARSTVQIAIRRLESFGILRCVSRHVIKGGRREQATNVYLFQPPALWVTDTDYPSPLDSIDKITFKEHPKYDVPPLTEAEKQALLEKWGLTDVEASPSDHLDALNSGEEAHEAGTAGLATLGQGRGVGMFGKQRSGPGLTGARASYSEISGR